MKKYCGSYKKDETLSVKLCMLIDFPPDNNLKWFNSSLVHS